MKFAREFDLVIETIKKDDINNKMYLWIRILNHSIYENLFKSIYNILIYIHIYII